jgi:hypothetical protein
MNESNKAAERDEVLYAFHQECAKPTAEQIIAWVRRFPQYADDIRAHASVARDWAAEQDAQVEESDAGLSARAYSQALNIIYNEEHSEVAAQAAASCQTFQQMLSAGGKEVAQMAINALPIAEPMKGIVRVILLVIIILVVIYMLVGFLPMHGGLYFPRR